MSNPGGRPAIPFDQELADEVCERIATTELGLEQVLQERVDQNKTSVSSTTIYKWLNSFPKFAEQSARARKMQAELLHDRAQIIAQQTLIGKIETVKETKDGTFAESRVSDNVERSKLIVQTMLKRAGQLDAKKYGDRTVLAGDPDAPLVLADAIAKARKRVE
jgi:IS30 family transposase